MSTDIFNARKLGALARPWGGSTGETRPNPSEPPKPMHFSDAMLARMAKEPQEKEDRKAVAALFGYGTVTNGDVTLPYRLYVPQDMEEGKKYPLVLFLHGGGERGDDNLVHVITNDGAAVWVREQVEGKGEKCFVLAPQSPAGGLGWMEDHLLAVGKAMKDICQEYPVDTNRLYLTGMSMGGGGSWRMNSMYPDMFAAVAIMCSAVAYESGKVDMEGVLEAADYFEKKPLWLFHAEDDAVVAPEVTRSLVAELVRRGRKPGVDFFYTEYTEEDGFNHGSWVPAYENGIMKRWLFEQSNAPKQMPPMGPPPEMGPEMEEMFKKMQAIAEARKDYIPRFQDCHKTVLGTRVNYRLYAPELKEGKKYPLVVVLHGIGECGVDNTAQLTANDGVLDWVKNQDSGLIEDCFVLAPQSPLPIPGNFWEPEYLEIVLGIIDDLVAAYPLDADRLYAAGLSLGGYGVWNMNRMRPDMFAALVTCCPACLQGEMFNSTIYHQGIEECAPALVDKPLWLFHAEDDNAVPVEVTKLMAQKLQSMGKTLGRDFFMTIFPAEQHWGHGSWDPGFKYEDMLKWLFEKSK